MLNLYTIEAGTTKQFITKIDDNFQDIEGNVNALENKMIEEFEPEMASLKERDYIFEQKEEGGWEYRKWNSGVAELWCRKMLDQSKIIEDSSNTSNYFKYSKVIEFTLPFDIKKAVLIGTAGALCVITNPTLPRDSLDNTIGFRIMRHQALPTQDVDINLDIKGRWK